MRNPFVIRPRVTPDPAAAKLLEQKRARFEPPPGIVLHRDRVQPRIVDDAPALLRRQAG